MYSLFNKVLYSLKENWVNRVLYEIMSTSEIEYSIISLFMLAVEYSTKSILREYYSLVGYVSLHGFEAWSVDVNVVLMIWWWWMWWWCHETQCLISGYWWWHWHVIISSRIMCSPLTIGDNIMTTSSLNIIEQQTWRLWCGQLPPLWLMTPHLVDSV